MGVHYNITIVPEYASNRSLEASVRNHFSQLIDGSCYRGNKTLRIIVFRPTGRPADEFRENVLPVLRGCDEGVYLFAAFSGGYKNISDLVPESETHRVRSVEPIYIQAGELVSQDSANYTNNQTAFRKMAELMCRQHGLMIIQATKKRENTPEANTKKSRFSNPFKGILGGSQDKDDYEPTKASIPSATRQAPPSYQPVARVGTACNTEHLVLLAGILHDSPNGIPVQELCKITKLTFEEIYRIVDHSPVLKRSPMGGRECICLSQNLKSRLNTMKEGKAYKEFIATQQHAHTPSTASLAELNTVKDSLDSDILDVVDKQFQLDGRLTDILSRCFELFLGQTETPMETALSPPDASQTEQEKQAEHPLGSYQDQPTPDQSLQQKPDPCIQLQELGPASAPEPEVKQDKAADPNVTSDPDQNRVQKPENYAGEDPSATDTFLLFLGHISSRPETLEGDLVELIERELHIPGKLKPTLNLIHEKIYGPKYSGPSLGCDRFLQIIEEPFEMIRSMKEVVRGELNLSDVELENGLRRVCGAIKSRKEMDV